MSNWIDFNLDVLAANPTEINEIETALRTPSAELLSWVASRVNKRPEDIAKNVKEMVSFEPVRNLGYVDPSVNQARRFSNCSKNRFRGTILSHIDDVSMRFPTAILLLEYWDLQSSYAGRSVIRAGDELQHVYDGNQQSQAHEWVLPNIFAPFLAEYASGLEVGSLWNRWITDLLDAVRQFHPMTGASKENVNVTTDKS